MKSCLSAAVAIMLVGCVSPEYYYDTYDKQISGSYSFAEPQLDVYATISNARGLHGTVQITARPDAKDPSAAPKDVTVSLKSDGVTIARATAVPVDNENYAEFDIPELALDFSKEYEVDVVSAVYGSATSEKIQLVKPFPVDSLGCVFDYRNGCEFFAKFQNSTADTYYGLSICSYYKGEIYDGDEFVSIRGIESNEVQKAGTVGVSKYFYVEGPREDREEENRRVFVDSVCVNLVKYSPALTTFARDLNLAEQSYDDGYADAPKQVVSNMIDGVGFCGSYYVVSKMFYNDVDYGNKLKDEMR
ncbi:MAG: hypothetical protein ACI35Q_00515 [Marinilabiliaceae bacterium]